MKYLHTPDGKIFTMLYVEFIDIYYNDHITSDGVMLRTQSGFQIAWQGEEAEKIRTQLVGLE